MRKAFAPDGSPITHQDEQVIRRHRILGFDEDGNAVLDELAGSETISDTDSFNAYVDAFGGLWYPEDLTFVDG